MDSSPSGPVEITRLDGRLAHSWFIMRVLPTGMVICGSLDEQGPSYFGVVSGL